MSEGWLWFRRHGWTSHQEEDTRIHTQNEDRYLTKVKKKKSRALDTRTE